MISRDEAMELVKRYVKSDSLIRHMLSVEFLMEGLARRLGEEVEEYKMAGLLHDLDYEEIKGDESKHGKRTVEILEDYDISDKIKHAILCHNELAEFENNLDKALYVADALSGLVYATALMRPDRKISTMSTKSIRKKYKDKAFARNVSREQIARCEELLGISLNDFFDIAIESMGKHEEELGLGKNESN
jgi:putative nucleotidyltransferase with HDIG domain